MRSPPHYLGALLQPAECASVLTPHKLPLRSVTWRQPSSFSRVCEANAVLPAGCGLDLKGMITKRQELPIEAICTGLSKPTVY
jgi:hypothetical protein